MSMKPRLLALSAILLCAIQPAWSQTPNLPEGPGKKAVTTYCSSCHGLSRVVASGYSQVK